MQRSGRTFSAESTVESAGTDLFGTSGSNRSELSNQMAQLNLSW